MHIIMTHPDLKRLGGIETYVDKMKKYHNNDVLYYTVGKRYGERGFLSMIKRFFNDYHNFYKIISSENIQIVHLNPSLEFKSFIREGIFLHLSKLKKLKTLTVFHGWSPQFESKISSRYLWLFKLFYGKNDAFIVLAEDYRKKLLSWGVTKPIHLESTTINDDNIYGFDIKETIEKRNKHNNTVILFISRIFKEKGVFETIEAYKILKGKHSNVELIIAGDGSELKKAREVAAKDNLPGVTFTGDIRGEKKNSVYKKASILCFPTYHNEGFPSCIVESMAFGLPIVTRPVGGIKDFFVNGINGYATDSKSPSEFASLIENLILDKGLYSQISLNNYYYAQKKFLTSKAVSRLESIYSEIVTT